MWFVDLESSAREDIEGIIPEPKAPSNYKDEAKIAAAKAENRQKMIDMAAVNVNFARIVVLGYGDGKTWNVPTCQNLTEEAARLTEFWDRWTDAQCPALCGFFNSQFDLPLIVRRSEILKVQHPTIELGRYRHPLVVDLAQMLTFDWMLDAEKLGTYAKVFGIPHDDQTGGKDVPGLIAAGNWDAVVQHCVQDLELTRALALRLGVQ